MSKTTEEILEDQRWCCDRCGKKLYQEVERYDIDYSEKQVGIRFVSGGYNLCEKCYRKVTKALDKVVKELWEE